jgi:hypothetical protein
MTMLGRTFALLPRRAGAETEPQWKQYAEGDPDLYDNYKGEIPENAEIDPNDDQAMAPDMDTSVPVGIAIKHLLIAFGSLFLFYKFVRLFPSEPKTIERNDWRTLPPSVYYDYGGDPQLPPPTAGPYVPIHN